MDRVTALERSYEEMAKLVANLRSEQLSEPTPCTGWDVRALLNHTFGAAWMFTLVNQGEAIGEDAGDLVGNDPSGAISELIPANVSAWRQPGALEGDRTYPFGTFPAPAGLMINVGEVAVHSWDLAKATGQD
ncbi:MAG TPA: TIGR03086 family metal-binding protein, partial [Acidimicrobiales bacterium]